MAPSIPTLTCPYCRHTFVGVKIVKHGAIRCGHCGKVMTI